MFSNRAPEADRNKLLPISSLPSKSDASLDDSMPARRPSSSLDHRQTPPAGLLPRPTRNMEPPRGSFSRPTDDPYAAQTSTKLRLGGPPPPPFARDHEQYVSPHSEEVGWRPYERPGARFGANEQYSPHMPPAPFAPRDESRPSAWPRAAEDPHRSRLPGPATTMRDDGPRRPASTSRDRADLSHEAFVHDRAREEEQWRDERLGRPMHSYDAPLGYPPMGPYPHEMRGGVRPFDAEYADDARRVRRRASSSLNEDEQNMRRYSHPVARPYGSGTSGTYSPPETRRQSLAPNQPAMRPSMTGMDPPRPASTLGTMNQTGMPNVPGAPPVVAAPSATTSANTVNANRRVAHLLSEQKRRESINTGFEDLRQAIPACRDGQDSKATILKRALEYIRELESVVERQHRPPMEGHSLSGYSNRSPPDDKDDLRRFGRPNADEERRGSNSNRQMPNSGNNSESGNGPRIGGMPSNAYGGPGSSYSTNGPYHARAFARYESANMAPVPHAAHQRTGPGPLDNYPDARSSVAKRWAEDDDDSQRSPSRRRVSDSDKDEAQPSPTGPNYLISHSARHSRSPPTRSPTQEKPRDWHPRMDNKSLVDSAVRA